MPARTILGAALNEYADYQDHIFSKETSEKISEKFSLKSEEPAYCTQKTVKRGAPAVKNSGSVGSKKQGGDEKEDKICPLWHKLSTAAEIDGN